MDREIVIERFSEENADAVAKIAINAWTGIHKSAREDLGDELYEAFNTGWQERKVNAVLEEMRGERGYVIKVDGVVAGFISYQINPEFKSGMICNNGVSSDFRGLGLGPRMYQFVMDKMKEEGMLYAQVITGLDEGHAPARKAYQKAGFVKNRPSVCYYKKLD